MLHPAFCGGGTVGAGAAAVACNALNGCLPRVRRPSSGFSSQQCAKAPAASGIKTLASKTPNAQRLSVPRVLPLSASRQLPRRASSSTRAAGDAVGAWGQPSVELGGQRRRGGSRIAEECMASATSAAWRAGTFPNGCETEADWVAAQKRGITWQQLSDPERQAVALDAVRQKVEAGDTWTRPADADVKALTTQRDAAPTRRFPSSGRIKDAPRSRQQPRCELVRRTKWAVARAGRVRRH